MEDPSCSQTKRRSSGNQPFDPVFETTGEICDVWQFNLHEQFVKIRRVIQKYKYVVLDTEFPGVIIKSGEYNPIETEYTYKNIKSNVDQLKLIQLGLAFFDKEGNTPINEFGSSTWQFNFAYDLNTELYARDSIALLQRSGIQFENLKTHGIQHSEFAELLMSSGVILMDDIKFAAFHSSYDFAYLLKIVTSSLLPIEEVDFVALVKIYFPTLYDVEHLAHTTKKLFGGLESVGEQLQVTRIGSAHQAGSDALFTGRIFFKIKEIFYENNIDRDDLSGHISGLSVNFHDVF